MKHNYQESENEFNFQEAHEELRKLILNKGLKWAEGIVPSGERSKWIFDLREVMLTPRGSRLAAYLLYEKLRKFNPDFVGGPTIAAEPIIASIILHSYLFGKPLKGFIVRKKANTYGLQKLVEGPLNGTGRFVVVDDSINSGNNILKAIEKINRIGYNVVAVLSIVDFCGIGHNRLLEKNIAVDYLFNLSDFNLDRKENLNYLKYRKINFNNSAKSEKSDSTKSFKFILGECIINEGEILFKGNNESGFKWKTILGDKITAPLAFDERSKMLIVCTYSGLKKGKLVFVHSETGLITKGIMTDGAINSKLSFREDLILFGCDDKNVYCIDRSNKNFLWKFKTEGKVRTGILIDEECKKLFFCSFDGFIYSIGFDGKLSWKKHIGNNLTLEPKIHSENLLVLSDLNILFKLDKITGFLQWFFEAKNKIMGFEINSDRVLLWCDNGFTYVIDYNSGKIIESVNLNDNINSVRIVNKTILISGDNGSYTFEA